MMQSSIDSLHVESCLSTDLFRNLHHVNFDTWLQNICEINQIIKNLLSQGLGPLEQSPPVPSFTSLLSHWCQTQLASVSSFLPL